MRLYSVGIKFTLTLLLGFITTACQADEAVVASPPTSNPLFIHLSDVHVNSRATSSSYGNDPGTDLWADTLAKLDSVLQQVPKPSFIIYTGDLPSHYYCPSHRCYLPTDERTDHNDDIKLVLDKMRSLAEQHNVALYYAPGNNDSLAGDYYSFSDSDDNRGSPLSLSPDQSDPYPALNTQASCSGSVSGSCMLSNPHPQFGYYSVRPHAGLRIIALNSIIFGKKYHSKDGVDHQAAGNQQISWLQNQLDDARDDQQNVWLMMHIPPGLDAYEVNSSTCPASPSQNLAMWAHLPRTVGAGPKQPFWQDQLMAMLDSHPGTVTGILYGHTHMDEVRRVYDSAGSKITEVAISAPGISPNHNNNPGFKSVTYRSTDQELMDFTTYYRTPSNTRWSNYTAAQTYACAAGATLFECLSAKSLADLGTAMDTVYMVKNGAPSYNTQCGIDIRAGQ